MVFVGHTLFMGTISPFIQYTPQKPNLVHVMIRVDLPIDENYL